MIKENITDVIIELIEDYFETYSDDISDCFTITYYDGSSISFNYDFKKIEQRKIQIVMDINKLLIAQCVIEELKNKSKTSYTNAFTVIINAINAEVVELLKKDTFKNV